jgi:hypothetical protein
MMLTHTRSEPFDDDSLSSEDLDEPDVIHYNKRTEHVTEASSSSVRDRPPSALPSSSPSEPTPAPLRITPPSSPAHPLPCAEPPSSAATSITNPEGGPSAVSPSRGPTEMIVFFSPGSNVARIVVLLDEERMKICDYAIDALSAMPARAPLNTIRLPTEIIVFNHTPIATTIVTAAAYTADTDDEAPPPTFTAGYNVRAVCREALVQMGMDVETHDARCAALEGHDASANGAAPSRIYFIRNAGAVELAWLLPTGVVEGAVAYVVGSAAAGVADNGPRDAEWFTETTGAEDNRALTVAANENEQEIGANRVDKGKGKARAELEEDDVVVVRALLGDAESVSGLSAPVNPTGAFQSSFYADTAYGSRFIDFIKHRSLC